MARIPGRFERVAAAFDTAAVAARGPAMRLCESSGSEHSPESPADLSDLVKSYIEREYGPTSDEEIGLFDNIDLDLESADRRNEPEIHDIIIQEGSEDNNHEAAHSLHDSEKKDLLRNLLAGDNDNDNDDDSKRKILDEAKLGYGVSGDVGSSGFKRRLMTFLRDKGFDAGLCKSKWEKSRNFPAGDYEYVDVIFQGTRYIVEAGIAGEFEIARPTDNYASLIEIFPRIFVGKVGDLKQIVRVMCSAIRQSMKAKEMPIPPWRRNSYMQAKWFGSYKRTTKPTPSKKPAASGGSSSSKSKPHSHRALELKRSIGGFEFEAPMAMAMPLFCRDNLTAKVGLRVSNLTAAFNG